MKGSLTFDGGSRGNPGPSAAAAVLTCEDGTVEGSSIYLGEVTNNIAEYKALILGIKLAQRFGVKDLSIKGDSKLVVNHLNGVWSCNAPSLSHLLKEADGLLSGWFISWEIDHIPRKKNKKADALVNETLDAVARRKKKQRKAN